jgi:hypothetical protein
VLQVVHRAITHFLLRQAGLRSDQADSGAVTLIQRFGSAANLNIPLHCLVLDGVYRRTDGEPAFVEVPAPTDEALQALLHKIIARLMKLRTRRGVLVEDEGSTYLADADADSDDARTLRPLQAAACTYRIAFGPRAGQKVLTVRGAMPRELGFAQDLCADMQGFSMHAAVRCEADDRQGLERLCRYITRPAPAYERVQCNAAGHVVLKLKTSWRDGTTHLVMSPQEFMQRLAALVPRPRLHLIRFHGVLVPNARLRAQVVPAGPHEDAGTRQDSQALEPDDGQRWASRISWARLLKRVFQIDLEHCPNCGGGLKIIAAILETEVIERILEHLGPPARAPPRSPARASMSRAARPGTDQAPRFPHPSAPAPRDAGLVRFVKPLGCSRRHDRAGKPESHTFRGPVIAELHATPMARWSILGHYICVNGPAWQCRWPLVVPRAGEMALERPIRGRLRRAADRLLDQGLPGDGRRLPVAGDRGGSVGRHPHPRRPRLLPGHRGWRRADHAAAIDPVSDADSRDGPAGDLRRGYHRDAAGVRARQAPVRAMMLEEEVIHGSLAQ